MRSVMIWPLRFEHRPMETSLYLRRQRRELTSAQPEREQHAGEGSMGA
jgi:hypothetical protein